MKTPRLPATSLHTSIISRKVHFSSVTFAYFPNDLDPVASTSWCYRHAYHAEIRGGVLARAFDFTECLLSAYNLFLDDDANEKAGVAVETPHDKLFSYDVPEYKSGAVAERNTKVYAGSRGLR